MTWRTRYSIFQPYINRERFYLSSTDLRLFVQQETHKAYIDKMKLFSAFILTAAAGSYAQVSVIENILSNVSSGIEALGTAAENFNGDIDAVKVKAGDLVSTLKSAKTKIDASSDLSLTDAVGLKDPVQNLAKKSQMLADDFKSKRSDIEKANACDTVRTELSDISINSQSLIRSVISKAPKNAQSIAQQLADELTEVLDQSQDDFSESKCKNSGSSIGTKTGSSSRTSTPTKSCGEISVTATALAPTTTTAITDGNAGNSTLTGTSPPVTAGACFLAPASVIVMAVVAALL